MWQVFDGLNWITWYVLGFAGVGVLASGIVLVLLVAGIVDSLRCSWAAYTDTHKDTRQERDRLRAEVDKLWRALLSTEKMLESRGMTAEAREMYNSVYGPNAGGVKDGCHD